ncbi:MAG: rhomboid family intramembrane serine protease [Gemmatimonadales bacterium]|jgi:membrane associated rhomboid family serine protease|nr:MAG: rhomboid family intramembrane serine protease [Gemmatimonadales bacterium]
MMPLTPWVKRLLVANTVVFVVLGSGAAAPEIFYDLAFFPDPRHALTHPWTGITYQFLHGGFGHLFFNMIALYFFGPRLEHRMGGRHFLALYLLSGFGGAMLSLLFPDPAMRPIVGASGAVYGVLVAYAALWPRTVIHIWAILPIEAWALALIMVVVSLWSGLTGAGGNVAHFAHLGGLAVGYGYLRIWDWRLGAAKREFKRKLEAPLHPPEGVAATLNADGALMRRWETIDTASLHELNREEVELLLEKARKLGVKALTTSERQFLDRMVQA